MLAKLIRNLKQLYHAIPGTEVFKLELYLVHDTEPETLLDTLRIHTAEKEPTQRKIARFLKKRCPAQVDLAYRYEIRIERGLFIWSSASYGVHLILGYAIRRLYTPEASVVNYPIIYHTSSDVVKFTVHSYDQVMGRVA